MDNAGKPTRTCSNGGVSWRRLSPRSHSNVDIQNASHSVDRWSLQRRLSPRLHKDCPSKAIHSSPRPRLQRTFSPKSRKPSESNTARVISSSRETPESNTQIANGSSPSQGTFSPKFRETTEHNSSIASPKINTDFKSQTPKVLSQDPSFKRRFSPRLHGDLANKTREHVCEDSSVSLGINPEIHASSVNQIKRRLSPRLRQNPKNNGQEDTSKESIIKRRLGPRLHNEGEKEKRKTVTDGANGGKRSYNDFHANNCSSSAKKSKHDHLQDDDCRMDFKHSHLNGTNSTANGEPSVELTMRSNVKTKRDGDAAPEVIGKSIHVRVKETLRIFNTYYLQFVQEEEDRRKKSEIEKEKKGKTSKSKEEDGKRTSSRPDLKAVSKMREKKEILYPEKKIGLVPGIEVGYQFFSRAEMVAIGFHSHWLNGIDCIGQSVGKRGENRHYNFPIAVAIVMSGQYEDDLDNSEDIIYTGQGGHDLVGSKLQCADQALVRGNLAMKNSMDQSVPVRVIRGHRSTNSYSGKIYTYDGLYKVVNTWADKGQRGHIVYKFRLQRLDGQPKLTTNQVHFVRGCPSKTFSELPGLVCGDISNGQEDICIPVTNLFDDAPIDPEGFTYIKTIQVAESVKLPPKAAGCACKGNCTNPRTCACAKLNGSDFPYVRRDGGRLVEAKDVVFECGPNCGCGPKCLNRTSQRGIKYRLEVYRTPDKGWAVRSWDFIPSGAPVCEYIGLLRRSDEVDNIFGNDYIFEIDCWHTINEVEGREKRYGDVPVSASNVLPKIDKKSLDSTPEFCIDAGSSGNVARFINHSCEPNLFVQCILSSHHDLRLARVVLFAADNIPPMQELTYDYGYALDSVIGADGKVKVLPCFCGTSECRKRLY